MGNLSEELMAELNCETAFTIPIFGGIPVAESVVVTWIIMAVLIVAAFFLGRNLKVENVGKRQLVVETVIGGLHNFFYDMLGPCPADGNGSAVPPVVREPDGAERRQSG